jgi:hypothetical protein
MTFGNVNFLEPRPVAGPLYIYYRIKELFIKLVIKTNFYYDALSEKHQIVHSKYYGSLEPVVYDSICNIRFMLEFFAQPLPLARHMLLLSVEGKSCFSHTCF